MHDTLEQFQELGRVLEEVRRAVGPDVLANAPATVRRRAGGGDASDLDVEQHHVEQEHVDRDHAEHEHVEREHVEREHVEVPEYDAALLATASAELLAGAPHEDPELVPHRHRSFRLSRDRTPPT
jgi:hypothetical protein